MIFIIRTNAFLFLFGIFFSNAILQIAVGLLFPFTLFFIFKRLVDKKLSTIEKLIILLFISGTLSIFISPVPAVAFNNIIRHTILLSLIPLLHLVEEDEFISAKSVGKVITIFAMFTGAMGLYNYLNGAERAIGFFAGYYTLASLMAFSIPITVTTIFYRNGSKWQLFALISAVMQSLALWLTFTRSAILGLMIGSLLLLFFSLIQETVSRKAKKRILISAITIVSIIAVLVFSTNDNRINPLLILENSDLSSGRAGIYEDAFKTLFTDLKKNWMNIFIGHGLNSRMILFPDSIYTSWESEYLESFMTQGLVGLILVFLIYFQFFNTLRTLIIKLGKSHHRIFAIGIAVSGISFWIISFFSSQLVGQNSSAYFVVLYLLFILVNKLAK